MKACAGSLLGYVLFAAALPSFASALETGKLEGLRMECDTCHGVDGVSVVPDQTPSLAGKSERYLTAQIRAFQTGKRRHDAMLLMGGKLTDDEIRQLALYYSHVRRKKL